MTVQSDGVAPGIVPATIGTATQETTGAVATARPGSPSSSFSIAGGVTPELLKWAFEQLNQAAHESASYLLMLLGALLVSFTELAGIGFLGSDTADRLNGTDFIVSLVLGVLLAIAGAGARLLTVFASARQVLATERDLSLERREQAGRSQREREDAAERESAERRGASLDQTEERKAATSELAKKNPYAGG